MRSGVAAGVVLGATTAAMLAPVASVGADTIYPTGCIANGSGAYPGDWSANCWLGNDASKYDRSGDYEVAVQRIVKAVGFNPGTVDGVYGSTTANAVKSYQSNRGLSNVDGVTGNETWGSLFFEQIFCLDTGGYSYYRAGSVSCTLLTAQTDSNAQWWTLGKNGTTYYHMSTSGPS